MVQSLSDTTPSFCLNTMCCSFANPFLRTCVSHQLSIFWTAKFTLYTPWKLRAATSKNHRIAIRKSIFFPSISIFRGVSPGFQSSTLDHKSLHLDHLPRPHKGTLFASRVGRWGGRSQGDTRQETTDISHLGWYPIFKHAWKKGDMLVSRETQETSCQMGSVFFFPWSHG